MKAIIQNTNTKKMFSTIFLLGLAMTLSFGQGLLAETAIRLFSFRSHEVVEVQPVIFQVNYQETYESSGDSFRIGDSFKNFFRIETGNATEESNTSEVRISRTIFVPVAEVRYEDEIIAEEWMTTSFNGMIENSLTTEEWMTESISGRIEHALTAEEWMTEDFAGSRESGMEVEEWMTTPFSEKLESNLETEEWMTQLFSEAGEETMDVEEWMTVPMTSSIEEPLRVEEWMTTPFSSNLESDLVAEEWMSDTFISK